MTISKTTALRAATARVSAPIRNGRNRYGRNVYSIYGPRHDAQWDGVRVEFQTAVHADAVLVRARWVARIALHMMSRPDAAEWIGTDIGSSAEQVNAALARCNP